MVRLHLSSLNFLIIWKTFLKTKRKFWMKNMAEQLMKTKNFHLETEIKIINKFQKIN